MKAMRDQSSGPRPNDSSNRNDAFAEPARRNGLASEEDYPRQLKQLAQAAPLRYHPRQLGVIMAEMLLLIVVTGLVAIAVTVVLFRRRQRRHKAHDIAHSRIDLFNREAD